MTNEDAPADKSEAAPQPEQEPDRQTQPVDVEGPPRLPFPVVGIGASAGGLEAVSEFLAAVRPDSGMAYVFIQHLPPAGESMLVDILSKRSPIPVREVEDQMPVEADHLYVIRPGCTLTIKDGKLRLGERLAKPMHNRPVDDFFESLAEEQRERGIAVILSGMGSNGTAGAQAVKAVGGLCIAQDPDTTAYPSMPQHLIDAGYADYILRPQDMPDVLLAYAGHPYAKGQREEKAILAKRDQQHLREILAVLRTRTRHDFNGYKKPTILRRVQRRMGLTRLTRLDEYAKLLRQSPSEVTALADDLLIHVTGFFRDAEAWEALRRQVVVPLIASRENDAAVRAWVTACSSGEEAYTLAILLTEEAERAGKHLDIKVFATDMAERTLANARAGVYPGGIEAEITPERLERFFKREDAVYRVRQDLRERVVFAPQNILQDPPFSRLDIASCRNLLIYLEPEMQARILGLLHFGLREGGALFLGTSETVGSEDMFESIDKKAKIYRRVGPTRHGPVDFPLPHAVRSARTDGGGEARLRPSGSRPTLAQITQRTLMERHLPAAVLVDRDHRVLYFQGDTEAFLKQPTGEPTRDLMLLAREGVRGAVRIALQRAAAENAAAAVRDGWIETAPGRRGRLMVTTSPAADKGSPDLFVVSFELLNDVADDQPQADGVGQDQADELRRVRDELQSTIEELQTSHEELKASHEEATSVNEEMQSTNEELETSKEEMQSLNEELSTVNAQLHAKMEEHQAARNDLQSLLSSTDIAVLFLDTKFRIRRHTPMVKDLLDLIATDVGRPLSDLARKFDDPDLLSDAEKVLERLVPVEKETPAEGGRWYLRRITPYRTTDDRIDGVVVAFIDIADRKRIETALREREEQFRRSIEEAPIPVIMQAEDGQVLQISRTWTELTGYVLSEMPTADAWLTKAYGPGADAVRSCMHDLFKGDRRAMGVEFDIRTRVGEERRWSFSASSPGTLGDGRRYIVGMALDVTERKEAEEATRAAWEAAELANRTKDEFLATLGHELRTPLSAILLWAKMLDPERSPPDQLREGLAAIRSSAEAQKELIEDLLDVSRITSGKLRLQMKEVELAAVVQEAVDTILPTARAKGVAVTLDLGWNIGTVLADPDRLRQVVWNLLTNAVKFTPADGRVDVGLWRHDSMIELRVADTGRGIAPEFLPHVFERFRQADAVQTRTHGGLGLGLAIVKQLVELHGGAVSVESAGKGQGATFTVEIPLPKLRKARSKRTDAEPAETRVNLSGLLVLLIEDDAETRKAVANLLKGERMRVAEADSAAAAWSAYEGEPPDLILSDIGLPGEDGYSLMRRIREREADRGDPPTPAIALTAFAGEADRRRTLEAGFHQHLAKPPDPDELLAALREALA